MGLNKAILMGRLTAVPEIKQTPTGVSNTSFTLAVDRNYQNNGERKADFINCVAWRGTAEFICRNFTKGKMISVVGPIQTRSWDAQDGTKRYATEVIVEEAYFAGDKKETDAGPYGMPNTAPYGMPNTTPTAGGLQGFTPAMDDDNLPF